MVTKPTTPGWRPADSDRTRFQYKLPSGLSFFQNLIVVKLKRGLAAEDLDHNSKFLPLCIDLIHNAIEVLEWTIVDLDSFANHECEFGLCLLSHLVVDVAQHGLDLIVRQELWHLAIASAQETYHIRDVRQLKLRLTCQLLDSDALVTLLRGTAHYETTHEDIA